VVDDDVAGFEVAMQHTVLVRVVHGMRHCRHEPGYASLALTSSSPFDFSGSPGPVWTD